MHSAAVDFRFRRLAGLTVLLAFLFTLSRLGETQNTTYSHGTTTCLAENESRGFKLVLTETNRCGANLYPRFEIEIRKLPIKVQKSIVIGPDNWAFRCLSANKPCEQVPSGHIVFDQLEEGAKAGSKTDGRYELRLRGTGVIERGKFTVDCVVPCSDQPNIEPPSSRMRTFTRILFRVRP
jgi:hypothetical protein